MFRPTAVLLAAVALFLPAAARACSVCGCGDPLVLAGDSMPVASTVRFALGHAIGGARGREPTGLGDLDLGARLFVWDATSIRAQRRQNLALTAGTTTNSDGYRYGDAVLWSAQLRFRVIESLALQAGIDGRYAGRDSSEGVPQENTGGVVVSAVPGLAWNVAGPIWLLAQVQIPFATNLFGQQTVGVTATASVQYVLN